MSPWRGVVGWRLAALAVLVLLGVVVGLDAFAQGAPFGVPRPGGTAASGPIGWILAKEGEFYRALSQMLRAAKADGSAVWGLLGLSFLYGIFHAAGPGHGKAVISSYVIANEETWKRGVVLSFASALLQSLVAVAVVGVGAAILGATAKSMKTAVDVIEIVSYALIALIGARLLWQKGRALTVALQDGPRLVAAPAGAAVVARAHVHDHDHRHDRDHRHAHHHDDHGHHGHIHGPGEACDACGHSHGPEPKDLAGPGGWQRGLGAVFGAGLRPCSGAILVLVFALTQGLFWAGIAAAFVMGLGTAITVAAIATLAVSAKSVAVRLAGSDGGYGLIAARGLEVLGAAIVLFFGLALLAGYIAAERLLV